MLGHYGDEGYVRRVVVALHGSVLSSHHSSLDPEMNAFLEKDISRSNEPVTVPSNVDARQISLSCQVYCDDRTRWQVYLTSRIVKLQVKRAMIEKVYVLVVGSHNTISAVSVVFHSRKGLRGRSRRTSEHGSENSSQNVASDYDREKSIKVLLALGVVVEGLRDFAADWIQSNDMVAIGCTLKFLLAFITVESLGVAHEISEQYI